MRTPENRRRAPTDRGGSLPSLTSNFTPSASTLLTSTNDLTATSYRDTTAAPGGTFYYTVVANSSKSNEVKVVLPADSQSSVSLQLAPGQGKATFIYLYNRFVNCANYGADQNLLAGADRPGLPHSDAVQSAPDPLQRHECERQAEGAPLLENAYNMPFTPTR